MSYPILVKRLSGDQAMTIVCEDCDAQMVIGGDDLLNEALYGCPDSCGGTATYMYDEADECGGCGKLGHYEKVLNYCCSRVCQLQAEYVAELKSRRSAA